MDNYIISYILQQDEDRRERQRRMLAAVAAVAAEAAVAAQSDAPAPIHPALGSKETGSRVIHITDLQDFCRCKRSWNWSSMLRRGLQPVVSPVPLFFGSAIHYALNVGYQECIGKPVARFDLKSALHAYRQWVKQSIKHTIEYSGPLWEFEEQQFEEVRTLGILMLRHYALWAAPLDKLFKILGMEYKFKVPLPGYETHGMEYAGRFDGYLEDIGSGTRFLLEFKTAKSIRSGATGRTSSNIEGVLRGMQSAAYTWASGRLPGVHDIPAQGVLYRFLHKRAPDMPKELQRGGYSRAKSIKSTVQWFRYILTKVAKQKYQEYLKDHPEDENRGPDLLQDFYDSELAQAAGALSVLRERQTVKHGLVVGNDFFLQLPMIKKPAQVQGVLDCLVFEGQRMIDPNQPIYPTAGFHCNWCSYKAVCDMIAYGHEDQVEPILAAAYGPREYWEPEVVEEY